ncbi:MAG: oligosaccharide flippase family protein [Candidatus Thermoplasmatota archaeon]|jgi:O-antigen/teichoic acid export membrane protein|nr:oligosaccharide flippase family protein [Candidatus Thermoplasmatota archaeon]
METSRPAWILLQNAYGLVVGYVTYLLILRDAGVSAFGIFSFALSFGMIFSFLSDLGINTAHTRMIAAGKDRNEYNNALVFMKFLLTLLYVGTIFVSIIVWTLVLHKGFDSPYEYLSILLLLPYFISLPYIQANKAFFTGTLEAVKVAVPPMVESTVRLLAVVVLIHYDIFHFASSGTGLIRMSLLIAASYSISYVAYAILGFWIGRPWKLRLPRYETIKDYMKYSYPLTGAAVASAVSANVAQILIQLFYESHALGGYASDLRFILMITGFTTSVTILILPLLTTKLGDHVEYGRTVGLSVKYLTVFITPITVFAIIFASPLLNLWTSQLLPFAIALQLMLIGSWFTTMAIPFWTHFNATGKTGISGALNVFGYLLIIIFDFILIPKYLLGVRLVGWGVNGAAAAMLISGVSILLTSMIALLRKIKIDLTFQSIKSILVSILLGALFYYFLHSYPRLPTLWILTLFVAYTLAYLGLILVTKTLSRQELIDILDMMNLKKLFKYGIQELKHRSQ